MSVKSIFTNPTKLIEEVRYEKEKIRYQLAIFAILPIFLVLLSLIISTQGIFIFVIAIYGFFFWLMLKFIGKVVKASLLMNLVEVNNKNFTELFSIITNATETIQYNYPIQAYVWNGSKIGLMILHQLDRKVFIIDASFLENKPSREILEFNVMFHVARLKTRSEYYSMLTKIISGIEKLWVLNILLFPFERATVYTADRIAMLYSGNPEYAQQALARDMVGSELGKNVNIEGIVEQGMNSISIFAWFARSYSSLPGYSHRFMELKKFSDKQVDLMRERHQC